MDERFSRNHLHLPGPASDEGQKASPASAVLDTAPPERCQACFSINCTDRVSLTSTLFGGGDWHWQLTDVGGALLADCGGYKSWHDCRAAVLSLQSKAGTAQVPTQE